MSQLPFIFRWFRAQVTSLLSRLNHTQRIKNNQFNQPTNAEPISYSSTFHDYPLVNVHKLGEGHLNSLSWDLRLFPVLLFPMFGKIIQSIQCVSQENLLELRYGRGYTSTSASSARQGFWAAAWRRCGRQWCQPYTVAENANEKTRAMMGTWCQHDGKWWLTMINLQFGGTLVSSNLDWRMVAFHILYQCSTFTTEW